MNVQQLMNRFDLDVRAIRSLFLGQTICKGNNLTIRLKKPYKAITKNYTVYDVMSDKTQKEITIIANHYF